MRHVPPLDAVIHRIDDRFRGRIALLLAAANGVAASDERAEAIRRTLARVQRWLDCIADAAQHRHINPPDPNAPLKTRLDISLQHAIDGLKRLDPARFRRRMPYHKFERAEGEVIYLATTTIASLLEEATATAVMIDGTISAKLFAYDLTPPAKLVADSEAVATSVS